jgi:DNA-binding IclR family transcriptional regulator
MKVQSIDRAFDIMEELSREPEGLSCTEISQRLNLPTSTVYRLLYVLRVRNYIHKNESNNVYRLGLGFLELTSMFLHSLELKTEARPYLRTLSRQTGQVVFLGTEQDHELVYIDKNEPFDDRRKYCFIGQRQPLHCTALGKTLLTIYTDDEIRKIYKTKKMTPMTSKTISDVEKLIEEVNLSRERQYSIDDEEHVLGHFCVSAPIYDYRSVLIAAVSTSWDLNSIEVHDKEKNIELIKECAREISIHMGFVENQTEKVDSPTIRG